MNAGIEIELAVASAVLGGDVGATFSHFDTTILSSAVVVVTIFSLKRPITICLGIRVIACVLFT